MRITSRIRRLFDPSRDCGRCADWLAAAVIALGVLRRVAFFLQSRSLWLDEAALAIRLTTHTRHGLIGPVGYGQAAPPLYLLFVNLANVVFGPGERAVRLASLLGGIALLIFSWLLARRVLPPLFALVALVLVSLSPPLLSYSAELKPYETDAAIAIMLVWCAERVVRLGPSRNRMLALSVAGVLAISLSFPSVFVLGAIGTGLFVFYLRRCEKRRAVGVVLAALPWLPAFAVLYLKFIRKSRGDTVLVDYWRGAFLPFPPRSFFDLRWPAEATLNLFRYALNGWAGTPALALFAIGLIGMSRRKPIYAWLLVGPLLAALAASSRKLYPFEGRLLLFIVPASLLLVASGLHAICERGPRVIVASAAALAVLAWVVPVRIAGHPLPPFHGREEMRPAVEYLADHIQPGDQIFVYVLADLAFRYYTETAPVRNVDRILRAQPIADPGIRSEHQLSGDVHALDSITTASSLWVVFSHTELLDHTDDQPRFRAHLAELGWLETETFIAPGAVVRRYQLLKSPTTAH